ncbi:hypothetical protein [Melittangium boletus]|uniref:Uncharacterized protein n=1 Tax=Melittangium boletus DSM 14713 TaxID=1294270 RepID=A0A250IGH9_9BACT|nr:hypothetical protein [Melittangium boletus]ATB30323.1 hypothetical protein MEBOL_003783 [Melittangium boletus DSM 14713]
MSAEQYFCEYCGYNSESRERCTHCGKEISDLFDNPPGFRVPVTGKLTLRLHADTAVDQAWKDAADVWKTEEETQPAWGIPSQLERFVTSSLTVEVYGMDYMESALRKALGERGTVSFQEIPHEAWPFRRPKYQLPRPPTVPRNKR